MIKHLGFSPSIPNTTGREWEDILTRCFSHQTVSSLKIVDLSVLYTTLFFFFIYFEMGYVMLPRLPSNSWAVLLQLSEYPGL